MRTVALAAICFLAVAQLALAADWAVIVAGSSGYDNYRHQADACHAYQVVLKGGIPASNIIMMMQDDVASDPSNPFPGKLFNKPTAAGVAGIDVYAGCGKDYTGAKVTAATFLAVITGDAVTAGGKVLQSTAEDRVFINFVDHGGTGLIAFPNGPYLYAADLIKALQTMHDKKMYSQLVFYMEACESGSMFEGLLPTNLNIYATTAANAQESSWGTYCPPNDVVNGVELNSCLGDLYSVNWMENTEAAGYGETLAAQYKIVVNETAQSHVMQFGDVSFTSEPIGDFQGNGNNGHKLGRTHRLSPEETIAAKDANKVDSRDITLNNKFYKYMRATRFSEERRAALYDLMEELSSREADDALFTSLAMQLGMNMNAEPEALLAVPEVNAAGKCDACCKAADAAIAEHCGGFNDYSLQYHRIVTNVCHMNGHSEAYTAELTQTIAKHCQSTNEMQLFDDSELEVNEDELMGEDEGEEQAEQQPETQATPVKLAEPVAHV